MNEHKVEWIYVKYVESFLINLRNSLNFYLQKALSVFLLRKHYLTHKNFSEKNDLIKGKTIKNFDDFKNIAI